MTSFENLRAALAVGVSVMAIASAAHAQEIRPFEIPAGDLQPALEVYIRQSGVQLIYQAGDLRGKRTTGVFGAMPTDQALSRLLAGSGMRIVREASGAVMIVRPQADAAASPDSGPAAQVEDVVVTGSRIRGVPQTAPVRTIDREEIDRSGFSQVGDLVRSLPENFAGGENPGHVGVGAANQNIANASTINLRGLGDGGTLVLLNGRRLPGNASGQSPDISVIPLAALSRIEVVTDGSSAIYGSDAVAGVANFIVRKDFDGAEISARLGGATRSGAFEQTYSALAGLSRADWHALLNVEYSNQDGIQAGDRDFTSRAVPETFLLRPQERTSAMLSAERRLNDRVSFNVDAIWSDRKSYDIQQLTQASQRSDVATDSESSLISAGMDVQLIASWRFELNATTAESLTEYVGSTPTTQQRYDYRNEVNSVEAILDGKLLSLPSGGVRSAIGVGWREDQYSQPRGSAAAGGSHDVKYVFGELYVPIVPASNERTGLNALEVSLSGRYEDYSDYGDTSTPKLGLRYVPIDGLTFRTTWGKSFKTATFQQYGQPRTVLMIGAAAAGGGAGNIFYVTGGSALRPERSTSWTAGVEYTPPNVPSLTLEATYFDIDYTDRVVMPISAPTTALSNPDFAEFVIRNPSVAQQNAFLGTAAAIYNFTGAPYDPTTIGGIVANVFTNAAEQKIHGFDLAYRQDFATGIGELQVFANATWISLEQRTISTVPLIELSGTVANVPSFRARAGTTWSIGDVHATVSVNYQNGGTDTGVVPARAIDSLMTVDGNIAYRVPVETGPLADLELALSVTNLFDEDPPFVESTGIFQPGINFDSVNSSAIGRFVAFSVRKRF